MSQIDREELADLVLALGNIDSPAGRPGGREKEMGEFVEAWLKKEGFEAKILALLPERPNVVGTYKGTGGGYSLLFNSHMDTATAKEDVWMLRNTMAPALHSAWREGDLLFGRSVVNDKGPMACFLIAAKAIKKAGIALKGDLVVTTVSGEMETEPVDEFQSPQYIGHDIGARYMVAHGGIADYALIAEGTHFAACWTECGIAAFKITLFGRSLYTPYIKRPYTPENHPNPIVAMGKLVEKIEEWALVYERKHTRVWRNGTQVPKASIGAVRGGGPYFLGMSPEVCSLYLDVRTPPGLDVLALKAELEQMVRSLRADGDWDVELIVFRRGFEAKNIDRLAEAVERAHVSLFKEKSKPVQEPICSMWRDINPFNEVGIPALTYGPPTFAATMLHAGELATAPKADCQSLDNLHNTAQLYAMIAMDICNQEKKV